MEFNVAAGIFHPFVGIFHPFVGIFHPFATISPSKIDLHSRMQ